MFSSPWLATLPASISLPWTTCCSSRCATASRSRRSSAPAKRLQPAAVLAPVFLQKRTTFVSTRTCFQSPRALYNCKQPSPRIVVHLNNFTFRLPCVKNISVGTDFISTAPTGKVEKTSTATKETTAFSILSEGKIKLDCSTPPGYGTFPSDTLGFVSYFSSRIDHELFLFVYFQ